MLITLFKKFKKIFKTASPNNWPFYEKGFLKSSVEIVWRDAKKKKKAMNEYAIRFFIEQARKNGIDLKKIRMIFKLNSRYFKKIKNVMLDEHLNRI